MDRPTSGVLSLAYGFPAGQFPGLYTSRVVANTEELTDGADCQTRPLELKAMGDRRSVSMAGAPFVSDLLAFTCAEIFTSGFS